MNCTFAPVVRCGLVLRGTASGLCLFAAATVAFAGGGDGGGTAKPSANPPATVENRTSEADLTSITLTPKAVERLAIKTETVRSGSLARKRFFGGELMVPPDKAVQLAAPFAGTIGMVDDRPLPMPGVMLKAGDPILQLQPVVMSDREVLTPSERIALTKAMADLKSAQAQADGDVEAATVQLKAATVRLERARKLREENATSEKALDEALAEFELSQTRLQATKAAARAWRDAANGMQADTEIAMTLKAPFDGILADLPVTDGEVIAAGMPVARFISIDPLWVRVPVYAGSVDELLPDGRVQIGALSGRQDHDMVVVSPVRGAPSANYLASSVDLFFTLANDDGHYRPQQRVGVWIPTRGLRDGLLIPWSAVLYDFHGGAWVYERTAPLEFVRRRVEIASVDGDRAQLSRGLTEGMQIVTDGAAELFGVEFGAGK